MQSPRLWARAYFLIALQQLKINCLKTIKSVFQHFSILLTIIGRFFIACTYLRACQLQ